MAAIIIFNCLLRQFTSWPVSLVFSFWEIQCVCWRLCHQFVSVAATNLWKAASDQAVWVTDGLWHDEWPQPFPHRPPLHGLCVDESPPLPVHLLAPLETRCAACAWQMLSDGPGCLWDRNQILLGLFQHPWCLDFRHRGDMICCLYTGSESHRI